MRRLLIWGFVLLVALAGAGFAIYQLGGLRALSAVTSRSGYTAVTAIPFGELPRQRLDIYTPDTPLPNAPVLVFFYGGGWRSGERTDYRFAVQAFAAQGVTAVIPDYRLYPEAVFPAFVEDAANAVAYVARTQVDDAGAPRPIVLVGHSAGAHIAALLNLDERYLTAAGVPPGTVVGAVGLSGPYDFLPLSSPVYMAIFPEPRDGSQPINFVDGTEPPMLFLTGDADETVDPANSQRLADRITAAGGMATAKFYPGVSHIGTVLALASALPLPKPPVVEDVMAFLETVMPRH